MPHPVAEPARRAAPGISPPDGRQLAGQIAAEVAATLSQALERLDAMIARGAWTAAELQELRERVHAARQVGIVGQQVVRYASGRVRLVPERLDLTDLLREALRQRAHELDQRGIQLRQLLKPVEVNGDATVTFSLLQAVLDWAFEHARERIDLSLDVHGWPEQARLRCAFTHLPQDEIVSGPVPLDRLASSPIDTVSFRLLQQTAAALGVAIERDDPPGRTRLTLKFHDTQAPRRADPPPAAPPQPLHGRHALVLSARREVRSLVREAVRASGVLVDFVTTVDGVRDFCRAGLPHAVVYEASLAGDRFDTLRRELLATDPSMAFVQIAEDGAAYEVMSADGRPFASVGREGILASLPTALSFEMARRR